jgi:hypothetical protein
MKIIKSGNSQIDAEWLMDNFREAVGRRKEVSPSSGLNRTFFDTSRIDALISAIESSSRPRTQFPRALQRFPFAWSRWLQKFVLKIYELLFREQRMINMSLAYVLREMKSYNTRLAEQLMQQQVSISDRLEKIIEEQRHINSVVVKLAEKYPIPN